jgi:hypothetical protein
MGQIRFSAGDKGINLYVFTQSSHSFLTWVYFTWFSNFLSQLLLTTAIQTANLDHSHQ